MDKVRADAGDLDRIHLPFLVASLLFAVFGGLTLAVSLPVQAALGHFNFSWLVHAQVHGHLQVTGFATLFVIGMAARLAPRFGRGTLAAPRLVRPAAGMLIAGILLRTIGQPLADQPAFAFLLTVGVVAEWIGALIFAGIFLATLAPAVRAFQPHATLLALAFFWFAAQATLGLWWLTELARDGGTLLEHSRNSTLLTIQIYGVLLSAILGVGTRSFPALFGMPPTSLLLSRAGAILLTAGVTTWSVALTIRALRGTDTGPLIGIGITAVGLAILLTVATFGVGRLKHRFSPASAGFVWAMQPVLIWLAIGGVALIWLGTQSTLTGNTIRLDQLDATRHIFLVGVVTLAILAMAQLMLPEFASERITNPPAVWRGAAFGLALSLAVVFRSLAPLAGIEGDLRWWFMALAGLITLVATTAFGLLFWRARRRHVAYMTKINAMRARSAVFQMVEVARSGDVPTRSTPPGGRR